MEAVQTASVPGPDEIWAILREVGEMQKENAAEMEKLRESQRETDRIIKERQRETDRIIKESKIEYDRRIGHLDNLFGEVAEYMIAPKLHEKFLEFDLDFPRANRDVVINDIKNNIGLEIDIMLENGDKAMLVEAKAKITTERIHKHIEHLEKMRKYADLHGDKRTFLGSIGGVVVNEEVRDYALGQGFFIIEPKGESFYITAPKGKPKEW